MEVAKIPQLQALLTPFEFEQIAMFPSILRAFYHGPLRQELQSAPTERLQRLQSVECHRVIDNATILMDAEAFWTQLNYQLVHLLDFLPVASWKLQAGDSFLDNFTALHGILTRAGKLSCHVDFDVTEGQSTKAGQPPLTLSSFLRGVLPSSVQLGMVRNQIGDFSRKIGHSLEYKLVFSESAEAI